MFYPSELIAATQGRVPGPVTQEPIRSFSIDSRMCAPGACFVALPGDRTHGGKFIPDVYRQGATAVMAPSDWFELHHPEHSQSGIFLRSQPNLILVPDTKEALWQMARINRKRYRPKTIAVTGSTGKTSTKEILRQILKHFYHVHASPKSFNNDLGVPLTTLSLGDAHDVYIQELGASEAGSIKRLADLVAPDIGILTNVGPAHLKGFKSIEGVYAGKLELAASLAARGGTFIYNGDDPVLVEKVEGLRLKTLAFGKHPDARLRLTSLRSAENGSFFTINDSAEFFIPTHATFQVNNVLAALTALGEWGIQPEQCREALAELVWPKGRFVATTVGDDIVLVDDSYNANPLSFASGLKAFTDMPRKRRIVVCADMLELGETSAAYHEDLGRRIAKSGAVTAVLAIGENTSHIEKALSDAKASVYYRHFTTQQALVDFLRSYVRAGDGVLFKGSRGMRLDEAIEKLETCFTLLPNS